MTGTRAHRRLRLDEVLKGGAGIVRLAEIRDNADALREGGRPRRVRRAEAQLPAQCDGGVSAPGAGRIMASGFKGYNRKMVPDKLILKRDCNTYLKGRGIRGCQVWRLQAFGRQQKHLHAQNCLPTGFNSAKMNSPLVKLHEVSKICHAHSC